MRRFKPEVLVVENNPNHLADAKAFFKGHKNANAQYVANAQRAETMVMSSMRLVDGVILATHIPQGKDDPGNDPVGILVLTGCLIKNIPVVLSTDLEPHSARCTWLNALASRLGIPLIYGAEECRVANIPANLAPDKYGAMLDNFRADHKDWGRALQDLLKVMDNNRQARIVKD